MIAEWKVLRYSTTAHSINMNLNMNEWMFIALCHNNAEKITIIIKLITKTKLIFSWRWSLWNSSCYILANLGAGSVLQQLKVVLMSSFRLSSVVNIKNERKRKGLSNTKIQIQTNTDWYRLKQTDTVLCNGRPSEFQPSEQAAINTDQIWLHLGRKSTSVPKGKRAKVTQLKYIGIVNFMIL